MARSPFHRIRKHKAFNRQRSTPLPTAPAFDELANLAKDDALDALADRLDGDMELAKRVHALQARYPVGTLPELVTYDWLQRNGLDFNYQVAAYGGRRLAGGLVPDFVVGRDRSRAAVWQVQGEYWHTLPGKREHDAASNLRLLGMVFNGWRVETVLELWENDILTKRPLVFNLALAGQGLRG